MGRPAPENLEAHAYTPTFHARTVAAYAKAVCYGTLFHPFLQEAAMVKKLQKLSNDKKKSSSVLASTVKDSAQQIWLAGLGAFAKAQEEGGKVFEALVKEGMNMQRKTQTAAEDKLSEASERVSGMANDIGARAAGRWDKLENIFEDRVVKALAKLGVPSARDIEALHARIDALGLPPQAAPGPTRTPRKAAGTVTSRRAASPVAAPTTPAPTAAKRAAPQKAAATAAAVTAVAEPVAIPPALAKRAAPKRAARTKATPGAAAASPDNTPPTA